jgi:hypothetical protein
MTIPVHIALSVMVLQTFTRRRWFWVWLAVLWHAAMDAAVVFISGTWGTYAAEAGVAAAALISLGLIFALRQPEPAEPDQSQIQGEALAPLAFKPLPVSENPDNLDDSRYSG